VTRCVFLTAAFAAAACTSAFAQEPAFFIGGGLMISTQSAGDPGPEPEPRPGVGGQSAGAAFTVGHTVTPHVDIAAEVSLPARFTTVQEFSHSFDYLIENQYRDQMFMGVVHIHPERPIAVRPELVGGFGFVRQDNLTRRRRRRHPSVGALQPRSGRPLLLGVPSRPRSPRRRAFAQPCRLEGQPRRPPAAVNGKSLVTRVQDAERSEPRGTAFVRLRVMSTSIDAVRDHLVRALDWEEAHVGFDKSVDGIPADKRGARAPGFEHSVWQLVEHIRIAQEDIYDFCVNAHYTHTMKWPDDYWPRDPAPRDALAWTGSLASYARVREDVKKLARSVEDLTAKVPTGKPNHTYLRALLLIVDHAAYHVGQIVAVRRALGIWK
jgi:hypothetical protein